MFDVFKSLSLRNKILIIAIPFIAILVGFQFIAKGEPYRVAVAFIESNTNVADKLGKVINTSLSIFSTSVRYSGPSGYAKYKISVSGDKGKGDVYIDLEKYAGEWKVVRANLFCNSENISLKAK